MTILFTLYPTELTAQQLIVKDKHGSETIIREHFSIPNGDSLFIDQQKLHQLLERLDELVYEKPINATLDNNGKIIPGKAGVMLDRHKMMEKIHQFFYGTHSYEIEVPTKKAYPKVDSELMAEISVKQIGAYTTYFNNKNKERTHNIALAAKAIDNYVVFPGEKFSFNQVVGKRTKEKGYMRAPVIVRGELAEDIGGGICQVSSTLFNAVNLHGVEIVERYSHSRRVPYVPPGKDATVSWWGPDFVFKNKFSHPLLIKATTGNGKMSIRIFTSENVNTAENETDIQHN